MFEAERIEKLSNLLRETSEAHREEHADTGGTDSEWPRWFAERMAEPLGEILDAEVEPERLARLLVESEDEHLITAPGRDWPGYYAEFLISRIM